MKLYVGNLDFMMTDVQLQALFAEHGSVNSAKVIRDRDNGQGRGFGFVEMSEAEALRAIESLNGKTIGGRPLTVNEARPTRQNSYGRDRGNSEKRGFGQYGRR
jgi:RNA recognition motif-containing protein